MARPIYILLRAARMPDPWFIFAQMRTINAIPVSIRYFGRLQFDTRARASIFLFISLFIPRSQNGICNSLLRDAHMLHAGMHSIIATI